MWDCFKYIPQDIRQAAFDAYLEAHTAMLNADDGIPADGGSVKFRSKVTGATAVRPRVTYRGEVLCCPLGVLNLVVRERYPQLRVLAVASERQHYPKDSLAMPARGWEEVDILRALGVFVPNVDGSTGQQFARFIFAVDDPWPAVFTVGQMADVMGVEFREQENDNV